MPEQDKITCADRRKPTTEGRDGRRRADVHCPDHFLKWEFHDKNATEQRSIICGSLARIEMEHKEDINRLDKELKRMADKEDIIRVETALAAKADNKDLRGLLKLVSFLVTVCILAIGGQSLWLRDDAGKLESKITDGFKTIHGRISETQKKVDTNMEARIASDFAQTKSLTSIEGQLGNINWRLGEIEAGHKSNNVKEIK